MTYPARIDYLVFHRTSSSTCSRSRSSSASVPRRATWARMALAELNRIHSHLVWLGTSALEVGAISMFWYAFDDRDAVLDLFELAGGTRPHTRYVQAGGLAEDLPPAFTDETRKFCEAMPKSVDEYEAILDKQKIWLERTKGIAFSPLEDALALGQSGPVLRASGSTGTCERTCRTSPTTRSTSTCRCTRTTSTTAVEGPRMDEMRESVRIVRQCCDRLDEMEGEPWIADDRKVVLPPRHELHTSMESLIYHFKIVTEGTASRGRGLRRHRVTPRRGGLLRRLRRRRAALARALPRPELRGAPGDRDGRPGLPRGRHGRVAASLDFLMGDTDR